MTTGTVAVVDELMHLHCMPLFCPHMQLFSAAGIAQLVECLTEKPGAILTWVRVPSTAKDFLPGQFSVHSLMMSVLPARATACINICMHVKNPKHWQP